MNLLISLCLAVVSLSALANSAAPGEPLFDIFIYSLQIVRYNVQALRLQAFNYFYILVQIFRWGWGSIG